MTTITSFSLKFKIYVKKVPVMTNDTLTQTIGFVNIRFFGHLNPIIF